MVDLGSIIPTQSIIRFMIQLHNKFDMPPRLTQDFSWGGGGWLDSEAIIYNLILKTIY
jgi:hypothetical protein